MTPSGLSPIRHGEAGQHISKQDWFLQQVWLCTHVPVMPTIIRVVGCYIWDISNVLGKTVDPDPLAALSAPNMAKTAQQILAFTTSLDWRLSQEIQQSIRFRGSDSLWGDPSQNLATPLREGPSLSGVESRRMARSGMGIIIDIWEPCFLHCFCEYCLFCVKINRKSWKEIRLQDDKVIEESLFYKQEV